MLKNLILLFFLILSVRAIAQILPKENCKLNYRVIGFAVPENHSKGCKVQVASGHYFSEDSFKKHIVFSAETLSDKLIADMPAFGQQYTWQTSYTDLNNKIIKSGFHHFSVKTNSRIDTTTLRLRIIKPAVQSMSYYVFVDGGGVLYDMQGQPVWFIPETDEFSGNVADIKMTQDTTITFIYRNAYEIDFNGDILWKAPNNGFVNGDTAHGELYHHEFTRLANGNYMILGTEFLMCRQMQNGDSSYILLDKNKTETNNFHPGRFGTLIEYDRRGNVVWSWKSSTHLIGTDFDYYNPVDSNMRFDPHDNAFYFNEEEKYIYLGYRNLSRIVKIEYPSGKIVQTYGDVFKPKMRSVGGGIFCNQHSIGKTKAGQLYVFNNNSCGLTDSLPAVLQLRQSAKNDIVKTWEYTCPVDQGYSKRFFSGGNAYELNDQAMFINMGSQYSKLLIVNYDKQILWSAIPEKYVVSNNKWVPAHQYRASIISRVELEHLIWKAESVASN